MIEAQGANRSSVKSITIGRASSSPHVMSQTMQGRSIGLAFALEAMYALILYSGKRKFSVLKTFALL